MTNSFYLQKAEQIFPIFCASIEEARDFVASEDHARIIETSEKVFMNVVTGSVDFESGWDDLSEVTEVTYDAESESWV